MSLFCDLPPIDLTLADGTTLALPEANVFSAWALRFDGYAYQRETGFIGEKHIRHFLRTGIAGGAMFDIHAAAFLAQRGFIKWGDGRFAFDSFEVAYMRALLVRIAYAADDTIPFHLRNEGWWDCGEYRHILLHRAPLVAAVARRHEQTRYEDFAAALVRWDELTADRIRSGETFGEKKSTPPT